jgi:hypothetical protein
MCTKFFVGKAKGKNHLEDLGKVRKIIVEQILGKQGWNMCVEFIWLRLGTSGRLFGTW